MCGIKLKEREYPKCETCEKSVKPPRRKYCSDVCCVKANHIKARQLKLERPLCTLKFKNTKIRTCLKCRKGFISEGPWNRLCSHCSAQNQGLVSVKSFVHLDDRELENESAS